jgi:hypothetical protein
VPGADPVQQVVHDLVVQAVAHGPAHARRAHPALLPEHAKRLGHSIFRSTKRGGEITDADTWRAMKAQEDLQPVRVRQQIESLSPHGRVDVGQR